MTPNNRSEPPGAHLPWPFDIPPAQLPIFRTGGLVLRQLLEADAEPFAALANNPNVSANTTDRFPYPYSLQTAQEFINKAATQGFGCIWGIEWLGKVAGGIGLHPRYDISRYTAELGYWLGEPYWGQGIATQAVGLVCRWALASTQLNRIEANVMHHNLASQSVLIKNGFRQEGYQVHAGFKRGQWVDNVLFGLLLPDLPR